MIKISNCRELDVFDHMDLLEIMQNKAVKLFCEKNNINVDSTCKFELDKKHFAILHKSSKKYNTFQLSYFDNNNEAYSDKEFNNLIEAVHYIYIGNKLIQVL